MAFRKHQGPYEPRSQKPYIGIIIFPYIGNTNSKGNN